MSEIKEKKGKKSVSWLHVFLVYARGDKCQVSVKGFPLTQL